MTVFGALQASWDAVTPPGTPGETGTAVDLGVVQQEFLAYVTVTGSNSDRTFVGFQGSIDGDNWYSLLSETEFVAPAAQPFVLGTTRYVRVVGYTLEGSPVISAYVAPAVG